jgi:GntR family transcriptional regulator/MocR family aminotransferase
MLFNNTRKGDRMITFFYDETSDVPKYVQLYRHIKSEIECGHLHYKEKMPSKRKLAEHLNMSAVTVETAYSQLVAEGYLKSVEKSGYYVDITGFPFTTKGKEEDIQKSFVRDDEHYLYDFRTNVVDTTLFPYSIWSKLSRCVLAEN